MRGRPLNVRPEPFGKLRTGYVEGALRPFFHTPYELTTQGSGRVGSYGTNSGSASVITLVSSATPLRRYLGSENIPRCVTPS